MESSELAFLSSKELLPNKRLLVLKEVSAA